MKKILPSQKILLHVFAYDADTGLLTWKNPTANCMHPGMCAGRVALKGKRHIEVGLFGSRWMAHRFIWKMVYGYDPSEIDHVDGNPQNNKLENLREVTHAQNSMNMLVMRTYKRHSSLKGVTKEGTRFIARVKGVYCGSFETDAAAHEAYVKKAKEIFGVYHNPGHRNA